MSREITLPALNFIKQCEGVRVCAYQDSADVWTIGYGHTGEDVYPGLVITMAEAEALLKQDLASFCDAVDDVTNDVPTNDNQFSAMVSLAFNIGMPHFNASTVLKLHRAGGYRRAADAFLMWNKAGGQVLAGLERRRAGERVIYLTGMKDSDPEPDNDDTPESGGFIAWVRGLFGRA